MRTSSSTGNIIFISGKVGYEYGALFSLWCKSGLLAAIFDRSRTSESSESVTRNELREFSVCGLGN